MSMCSNAVLQAAAVIAKTTQTLVGVVIPCEGYDFLTLFFTYTKGDETGLILTPIYLAKPDGTVEYPATEWSAAVGAKTGTTATYTFAATTTRHITFDVRGVSAMKFTQGGSNNDGTPTGTLAASYTLKKG